MKLYVKRGSRYKEATSGEVLSATIEMLYADGFPRIASQLTQDIFNAQREPYTLSSLPREDGKDAEV